MSTVRSNIQFLSKIGLRKVANSIQLYLSYYLSKVIKKPIHWGLPSAIAFEPTTSCNLRCPECPSGLRSFSRPTGMLKQSLFHSVIDQLAPTLSYLTFYFQGEPYLNPSFLEMVSYANEKNVYTATSTNAHYLDSANAERTVRSGLDKLIISIDGTSQETYESYRIGGDIEKVKEGTRNIIHWKKKLKSATPHVVFQFLVVKPNEHQIEEVHELTKELGVDQVTLKTAQVYDYENGNPLIPENEKYARYKRLKDGTYQIKNTLSNSCWKMWYSCVITWDGKVVPCCFDKDAAHPMGSAADQSFKSLWNSDSYQRFRQTLLISRSKIEICKNCTEGTKVFAS